MPFAIKTISAITTKDGGHAIYGLGGDNKVYIWRNGKWAAVAD